MNSQLNKQAKIFIISGPSGSGKTTLVNALLDQSGTEYELKRVITYTTKQPRPGEVPGVDYHFIDAKDFEQRRTNGFFIEWSQAYGTYYGSPVTILHMLDQGVSPILIVDRVGAEQIIGSYRSLVVSIWIYPPNRQVLEDRLRARKTENNDQIIRRMDRAVLELASEAHNRMYDFHILNNNFMCALEKFQKIVYRELKCEIDFKNTKKSYEISDLDECCIECGEASKEPLS
jgi:guanylate kinase